MLGGEYNRIITSKLANQHAPKALFTGVVYTNNICQQVFFILKGACDGSFAVLRSYLVEKLLD